MTTYTVLWDGTPRAPMGSYLLADEETARPAEGTRRAYRQFADLSSAEQQACRACIRAYGPTIAARQFGLSCEATTRRMGWAE